MRAPSELRATAVAPFALAVLLLGGLPACEGDLAIDTSASRRGPTDPGVPDLMGYDAGAGPRLMPDEDAGPGDMGTPPTPPPPSGPPECVPLCDGRQCGPDGCGGECGSCGVDATCNEAGQCEALPPAGPVVTLYGADWCGYCQQAKRFFNDNGVEFTDRDLDEPGVTQEAADRVYELTGRRSVATPTIIIDEHVILGWSEAQCREYLGL